MRLFEVARALVLCFILGAAFAAPQSCSAPSLCSLRCGSSLHPAERGNLALLFQQDQSIKQIAVGLIESFLSLIVGYLSPFPQLLNLLQSIHFHW
jgi:hypothetical protein